MKNKTAFLFAGGMESTPAVTLGQGLPAEVNGLKAAYYWRPTLRDGYYKHPLQGWEMVVTPDYRKELAASFQRMREAGLDVPVVRKHDGLRIGGGRWSPGRLGNHRRDLGSFRQNALTELWWRLAWMQAPTPPNWVQEGEPR